MDDGAKAEPTGSLALDGEGEALSGGDEVLKSASLALANLSLSLNPHAKTFMRNN